MKKDYLFSGAITELIAPMDKNEEIDYGLWKDQIDFQLEAGIDGIFLSGLTECMVTSLDEQIKMMEETVKTVNGKVPVMGNIATNRPPDALRVIRAFESCGADAVCITQPYIFPYDIDEIYNYYTGLIQATKKPVYVYNAPQTNNILSPGLVNRLVSENENVRGYKDSLLDVMHLQSVMAELEDGRELEVIAGSDNSIYATMAMGGCGVISWVSVILPQLIIDLCHSYLDGDIVRARELQYKVYHIRKILRIAPMDTGYRYVGSLVGVPIGYARRPMTPSATDGQKAQIREKLEALGIL